MIQAFLGFKKALRFPGDAYVLWALSSFVFFYGGWPFLKGLFEELAKKQPAMMTLIAIAITTAYVYSSVVVFGLKGKVFFWELATLIDIMLLGHWIEMKSIMGASRALEELAKLMPSEAHKVMPDGSTRDVSLDELETGDRVLIKPGEKVPVDGEVVEGETSVNEAMLTGESKPVQKAGRQGHRGLHQRRGLQSPWRSKRPARIPFSPRSSIWSGKPRRANRRPRTWPTGPPSG